MRRKNQALCLLMSIVLAISLLVPATAAFIGEMVPNTDLTLRYPSRSFTDVKTASWYYESMNLLVRAGGIDGFTDGTFQPNAGLKLSEFIKIVVSILYPGQLGPWEDYHIGGDVVRWYSKYVGAAEYAGLLRNVDYSRAALEQDVNRYTMATILVNAAEAMGEPLSDHEDADKLIYDYASIPHQYRAYVRKAYMCGLLNGVDDLGTFAGNSGLRRSEACAAIVRLFSEENRVDFAYSYQIFGDYLVTVFLPPSWVDRAYVYYYDSSDTDWVDFYCAASYYDYGMTEGGAGRLFSVVLADEPQFFPECDYWGSIDGKYVYLYYPSDVQFDYNDPYSSAEYTAMCEEVHDGSVRVAVRRV
jgi:hypothetical protein